MFIKYLKLFPAISLLALAIAGNAQPANINISNEALFDGEPFLAVNPTNPQNMVIAWMGVTVAGGVKISIKTETSFDGGTSWGNLLVHPHMGPTLHSADVSMAFRNDGALFISYIDYDQSIDSGGDYIQQSADGGVTWSTPVLMFNANEQISKEPIDRAWLAIDNSNTVNAGTLYLTTKPAPWISPPNRPYLKVSSDSGHTWSAFRNVDSTGYLVGNIIQAPMGALTTTADGALCIAYPTYLPAQNVFPQMVFAKSYNKGVGFSYTDLLTFNMNLIGSMDTSYKLGHRLSANSLNANQLVFADVINEYGDPDIFASTSNDGGATWSNLIRVNDDSIGNHVAQDMVWAHYGNNGDLLVTWRDRRNALPDTGFYVATDFYAAVSHDNGATFQKNIRLSNVSAAYDTVLLLKGNDFMSCSLYNDTIEAVWGDTRNGYLNIYFSKTSDSTGISTGVVKVASEKIYNLLLYPNPAQNEINLIFNDENALHNIEVLNEAGQVVMKKEGLTSNSKLDCSQLQSGVYFVRVLNEEDFGLSRFVVSR
jgi:hypothetical protein